MKLHHHKLEREASGVIILVLRRHNKFNLCLQTHLFKSILKLEFLNRSVLSGSDFFRCSSISTCDLVNQSIFLYFLPSVTNYLFLLFHNSSYKPASYYPSNIVNQYLLMSNDIIIMSVAMETRGLKGNSTD